MIDSSVQSYPISGLTIILTVFVIAIITERFLPYKEEWNKNQGDLITDILQSQVILPIMSKLGELAIFALVAWLASQYGSLKALEGQPFWLRFIVFTLVAELVYYWVHRLAHTIRLFWRFHAVHHGSGRVYWANSARFNFVEGFFSNFFYVMPFAVMGATPKEIALFYTLTATTGLFEHVNIDFKGRYLNYVFNTAHLHRWHHSVNMKETNTNYGKILATWDLVFGTWFLPKDREVGDVGIRMTRPVPNSVWQQTIYPFTDISLEAAKKYES